MCLSILKGKETRKENFYRKSTWILPNDIPTHSTPKRRSKKAKQVDFQFSWLPSIRFLPGSLRNVLLGNLRLLNETWCKLLLNCWDWSLSSTKLLSLTINSWIISDYPFAQLNYCITAWIVPWSTHLALQHCSILFDIKLNSTSWKLRVSNEASDVEHAVFLKNCVISTGMTINSLLLSQQARS